MRAKKMRKIEVGDTDEQILPACIRGFAISPCAATRRRDLSMLVQSLSLLASASTSAFYSALSDLVIIRRKHSSQRDPRRGEGVAHAPRFAVKLERSHSTFKDAEGSQRHFSWQAIPKV
jgi:hypothetical protein